MKFTQIKESCLYVKSLEDTEAFYKGKLGLPVIGKVKGRHIFFRLGSSVLLCFIAESSAAERNLPPHFASGKQHIAFEVGAKDYYIAREMIEGRGISITHEQKWREGVYSFYFEDPDGHVLEVVPSGMWD